MKTPLITPHLTDLSLSASASHEHAWQTESAHTTSEGLVLYVRCADCGTRRVDLQARATAPPVALSAMVRGCPH